MGFKEGVLPEVDPATFMDRPYLDRIKTTSRFWAENGFGTPKMLPLIYIVKVLVLHIGIGVTIATLTSGFGVFDIGSWWNQPIVYQKLIMWTVLLEALGLAGSWGPLAGHFAPMTSGFKCWLRPETIRLPPWPDHVPFTEGDRRTVFDVLVYAGVLVTTALTLFWPKVELENFNTVVGHGPDNPVALVNPVLFWPLLVLLVVYGLRDKVGFVATRPEQYMPAMVFFAIAPQLGLVDLIIALKLLIVIVWLGAGISKIGKHFGKVIPPMISNAPWMPSKALKRAHYRSFPEDLQPSGLAHFMAHGLGTFVEIVIPLVLLFTTSPTIALIGVLVMVAFHLFILSTFPLAVPLEWNALFAYGTVFLFLGFGNNEGFSVFDAQHVPAIILIVAGLLFFPILGNLRPDLVSFLPSMRQYAGNWASAQWAIKPEAEKKLEQHVVRPSPNIITQLQKAGYPEDVAEVVLSLTTGWRSMHSQGPGLMSVLLNEIGENERDYRFREAEFACNSIIAFNFGDGHFHNEDLIRALQRRCNFEPGEFLVAWVESQPIHKNYQEYKLIDAALGVIERGTWQVKDSADSQPWLPDGLVPRNVTWRRDATVEATR
ncbi:hypothetical protein GOARA_046_00160 [Gordonia araii NBRC 100433]|uniref:DUF3556 domain-containing protein n=1 Tax=Gordonia araii NBRC 100433 TaxID=1073574 RepID=G7H1M2_9ACTN|nr:DUF3556 domain-containing protein [Gordonia araii]NNG98274.1 DUF3556 family protein [Gordonia araii NBRC 100433]GAB09747.1 hypothetical protein GOARA_046_00160 [Gordonia araii NBRC 100433]